jgi:predicted dinucleotide-binding enzyme
MSHIAIVGLGYVGLPLALQFARSGAKVLGLDIDPKKTDAILAGRSYIKHVSAGEIATHTASGALDASTDFSRVAEADAVILCVPTPLNHFREPDLSYVLDTGKAIVKPESEPTLVQMVKLLQQNASLKVFVVGHTDGTGTLETNVKLSADRAAAVVSALTSRGIDASRLKAAGAGPWSPVATNRTDEGKAKNRRVELVERL